MPGTIISNSPNISLLDSKIIADTCGGKFYTDVSPSIFIGGGASLVLGAKVQITNPYDVIIKDFGGSFDIVPPMTGNYEFNIPTQAGKQQYGNYKISVQLTDSNGELYYVTKLVNVCSYNQSKDSCEELIRLIGDCKNGTLTVYISEPPPFKGVYYQSRTLTGTLEYPTASGIAPLSFTSGNFSVQLFEGVYKVSVSYCATYNMGDNILIMLGQSAVKEKNVKCTLDLSCIFPRIEQLNSKLKEDCSERERERTTSIILDSLRLITTANLANEAGQDPSEYITELEKLLGCTCTCDCNNLPIINGTPSSNVTIEGCNVSSVVVGLTTVYTIDNYAYVVTVNPDQSIITISSPTLDGCTYSQQIGFNVPAAYAAIKTQINSVPEYNYWASVINNTLSAINATCLGYNGTQWGALTFSQKFAVLVAGACAGGNCTSSISSPNVVQSGADVVISWSQTTGYAADVFVDGILVGTVLVGVNEIIIPNGADGNSHNYLIVPKCSNGSNGTAASGSYVFIGCPTIPPPSLSQSTVTDDCPYDLTTLETAPPPGITIEWHNANNVLQSSLVGNPAAVSSGTYYAFAKDGDGCYSTSSQVILTCNSSGSCTAPLSLSVGRFGGDLLGYNRILFSSAAYPPPGNSYTVKRKLASDPDVDGSYVTIGTPTFNSLLNKWSINDNTADENTLYTYKAQSNCTSTAPYILYNYATILCPSNTLTPTTNSISYSFGHDTGGQVDKYEVILYDSTGTTQLQIQTIIPPFSNPITGTFPYLTGNTQYKVKIRPYIGSIYRDSCTEVDETTDAPICEIWQNTSLSNAENISYTACNGTVVSGVTFTPGSNDCMQPGTITGDGVGQMENIGTC